MEPVTLRLDDNGGQERSAARKRGLYESRREREFYSYYESVLAYANTEPKFCDLRSPEAVAAHRAVTSSDTTLTAFVQLAALQIGTRRAMIFFFDAEYAYVIAESTRTLSLQDDDQHGLDDSLWLGFTKIPRGFSVCEITADLPINEGSNAQDPYSTSLAHIINNLTEDTRFCDRPYVKDGPKARFYAGVPITTPKGINIGALCVLDDKPRDGLEPSQVEFLRSMASTVMSHLELVRAKEENQRSRDMNSALAAFVEGKSNSADWWHRNDRSPDDVIKEPADTLPRGPRTKTFNDRVPSFCQTPDLQMENSAPVGYFESNPQEAVTDDSAGPPVLTAFKPHMAKDEQSPTEAVGSSTPNLESRTVSADSTESKTPAPSLHTKETTHESDLPTRIRATATRAASLIQKGVGADGVLFLDATVGSAGSLIDSTQGLFQTETETETDGSRISDTSLKQVRPHHYRERGTGPAEKLSNPARDSVILGSAYSMDIEVRVRSAIEQAKFSEKVLKSLLRRYPNGQVWHFNAEGDASDEDDSPLDEHTSATDGGESAGSELELEQGTIPTTKRASKRARTRQRDGRAIQSIFPGIRSLVFLGMWDPHQERWFGASIAVSYSSMRIFSVQNELSYIAAFCDVVLAEIWRLEAQELGRSKNDFVSSISHELRSPLGSAECLEEQEHSALSAELIRSITSCGNTLLDVVNDLLEYSRLNHNTQNRKNMYLSGPTSTSSDASTTPSNADIANAPGPQSGFMIDVLTEDAVNAACLGFDHQSLQSKGSGGGNDDHFAVLILNIEDAQSPDWLFSVASGSWKRVCINLVSNALKYTPSGYINVTLRKKLLQPKPGRERSALIELVVEDSGIGMSDEFQVKSLFRPFRQENNLTTGTGLGLNIVAQIVKSQGGTVHVRSKKGRGTTVKVSLPLRPLISTPSTSPRVSSLDLSSPPASVGFFGYGTIETDHTTESINAKANKHLLSSMKRYCMQLGIPVYAADDILNSNASVHIISEQALKSLSQTNDSALRRSLLFADSLRKLMIIICTTRDSALRLRSGPLGSCLPHGTQYLWLPIGPAKLAGALSACRMYYKRVLQDVKPTYRETNMISVGVLEEDDSDAVVPAAPQTSSQPAEEEHGPAHSPSSTDIGLNVRDEDKSTASPIRPTSISGNGRLLQIPQSPRPQRSGSEAADKPIISSLPLRVQINRASTAPCVSTGTLSLLLVDDNAINLRLLEVFAKKEGHVYRTAQNGQEAVEVYESAAKQERPDDDDPNVKLAIKPEVVLMDINMPVMDGFEAARAIRRFENASRSSRATIVAVTGLGDTPAQEQAFASGMDMFLTKPVKLKEMTAILSKLQGLDA